MTKEVFGPGKHLSTKHITQRLIDGCKLCEFCGGNWHFQAVKRPTASPSINICGRVMAVRKAAYIALVGKVIKKGFKVSAKCSNPYCINPELLTQVTSSQLLSMHYTVHGSRSKHKAAAHLMKYTKERTRLSEDVVSSIRCDNRKGAEASHEYGIGKEHYNAIQRGAARVSQNPFIGLMR